MPSPFPIDYLLERALTMFARKPQLDLTRVFKSPMRVRILELFTRDTDRSMTAEPLTHDLIDYFPEVTPKQVNYHLAVLRDARLIPAG
jgi:Fe2+ or Zn2+ uptake regulation protein